MWSGPNYCLSPGAGLDKRLACTPCLQSTPKIEHEGLGIIFSPSADEKQVPRTREHTLPGRREPRGAWRGVCGGSMAWHGVFFLYGLDGFAKFLGDNLVMHSGTGHALHSGPGAWNRIMTSSVVQKGIHAAVRMRSSSMDDLIVRGPCRMWWVQYLSVAGDR